MTPKTNEEVTAFVDALLALNTTKDPYTNESVGLAALNIAVAGHALGEAAKAYLSASDGLLSAIEALCVVVPDGGLALVEAYFAEDLKMLRGQNVH